jgi:uncharacterized protein (DUF2236 family)
MDDATADAMYAYSARMGTTLQVRDDMWPADRDAFAVYWKEGLAKADIDDRVRRYLTSLANLENLPKILRRLSAKRTLFFTKGFLPQEIREQMHWTWSDREEAKFARHMKRLARIEPLLPRSVKLFPFNVMLRDLRRRVRLGKALV